MASASPWDTTSGPAAPGAQFASLAPGPVRALYAKYGVHAPTDEEVNSHLGNPGGMPAVEKLIADAPDSNHGVAPPAKPDVRSFIKSWQQEHNASEGIAPLADALAKGGYNAPRFMYGATPSNNELVVDGQKFKVMGAENGPNPFWFTEGSNDSAGGGAGASPWLSTAPPAASGYTPVLSEGDGPGSYAWRQAQIYELQRRLMSGGSV